MTNLTENVMDNLKDISINELLDKHFIIPSYQRGYRWTEQQVKDLLNDIQEFIDKQSGGFYCIQPLVVKEKEQENLWEIIDGQQRLTTIFLILKYLEYDKKLYSIEYKTRKNSEDALEELNFEEDYIDFHHMRIAHATITNWFEDKNDNFKETFKETLLDNVKFIWYKIDDDGDDENPIKVFTRLNIGKIPLTNAELIKAMLLNQSNFEKTKSEEDTQYNRIRLKQQEMAGEWDTIEYTLQNDEFWLFLNSADYHKTTRIELIFDLICEQNSLDLIFEDKDKELGTDSYRTFRYFYKYFQKKNKNEETIVQVWSEVKTYFQIFKEWFNDLELYHYIGYLIEVSGITITELVREWKEAKTKDDFLKNLKDKINAKMAIIALDKQYEVPGSPKTQCRPILLLYNVQTVINQSKELMKNDKYKLPIFYKFPFHLYKKENWDIEHIDSYSENALEKEEVRREWLKASYFFVNDDLKKKISNYLEIKENEENISEKFYELHTEILDNVSSSEEKLNEDEKNQIWNFCLLDASTNRSYGNAIFPAKRRALIGKDQGVAYTINDENFEWQVDDCRAPIAFVAPCTKNVFLKYYNPNTNNLREWTKEDAIAYKENIQTVLEEFFINQNRKENVQ